MTKAEAMQTNPSPMAALEKPAQLSRRELNKLNKRSQIKAAVKELFGEVGFEKATLRDIATKAQVGLGTVMLYAQDKRDLVLLMYNDEIEIALKSAGSRILSSNTVLENLLVFFEVFYERYADNILLARTYLQINFFADGMHTAALKVQRAHKKRLIATIIELGQSQNALRADVSAELMAEQVLFLHRSLVRAWISEEHPNIAEGMVQLKQMLRLQIEGLSPLRKTDSKLLKVS